MSTANYPLRDSATMVRRQFRHTWRSPETMFGALIVPIILLLLFNYFFGGAMNVGTRYLDYMVPGVIMLAAGYGVGVTAVGMATDVADGVVNRFRTMAISRASVPTGHVLASLVTTMGGVAIVLGVTVLMGFRPDATPVEWVAAIGLIVALILAITWLTVALALAAPNPAAANFYAFPMVFLPFLSTAFAPADSMSGGVRWFVENQPFSRVIETLRGLMTGTAIGDDVWWAVGWCVGIGLVGYLWARALFNREPRA